MEFIEIDILKVLLQSIISFIVLFVISKLLGKKQVSQLSFIDYAIGISIGSIAAEMATDSTRPFYHFIVAMVAFGLLDLTITLISRKTKILKKVFIGRPQILIENGEINYSTLRKSKLDIDELMAQCRLKGYFYLKDIQYCIFERSGDFSILPVGESKEITVKDLNLPTTPASLQKEIVIDGTIIERELELINKSEEWLLSKLNISNKKEIKNILLAVYDKDANELCVYDKKNNKKTIKANNDNKNNNKKTAAQNKTKTS